MQYETITIPVETEINNMTMIENESSLEEIFGKTIVTSLKNDEKVIFQYKDHPVLQGFVDAYKNHRSVTISPDIIWLLIIQGFSYHVTAHAEELRSMFVNFDNKKQLTVKRLDLNAFDTTCEDWMSIFPSFIDQITELTGNQIIDILTPSFTTSDPISTSVGQISIMSAFRHYFKYNIVMLGCGIPYVTIEGSIEDWQKISEKLEKLKSYKLEKWIHLIDPIINKIIDTKKGNIDQIFWRQMIKVKDDHDMYDPGYVDGWFINFFPYDDMGNYMDGRIYAQTIMPSEMLAVPFELKIAKYEGQKESEMEIMNCEILAGFIGLTQDKNTASIKPKIGWLVRNQPNDSIKMSITNGWNK